MKPKTKPAIITPTINRSVVADAIIGKKEKPGGEYYELTEPHKYFGQKELSKDTTLTECNDGYFKIVTPMGPIEHYRVKIETIPSNKLQQIKKEN